MSSEQTTCEILGMMLPVLADLPDGWKLVAHPNGPAVGNKHYLSTLDCHVPESCDREHLFFEDDDEPEDNGPSAGILRVATRKYVDLTWPAYKLTIENLPDFGAGQKVVTS